MNKIEAFVNEQLKQNVPQFNIGDTVKVHNLIKEGTRERIQIFEGTVIAKHGGGISETFTVRRVSYGIGVEHSFLVSTVLLGTATLAMQKDKKPLHYAVVIVMSVVIWFVFTQLLHVRLP